MSQQIHTTTIAPQLKGFEDEIHAAMKDGKVPGAAVLLIKDGEVLFSQGFGKRNVAENLEVTPRTLFPIGSSGKAFTAAAIAMLILLLVAAVTLLQFRLQRRWVNYV